MKILLFIILLCSVIIRPGTKGLATGGHIKIMGDVKIDSGATFKILPGATVIVTGNIIIKDTAKKR